MATVVVDTCVLSFLHKNHDNADLYRPHLEDQLKVISFMTVAELYRWAIERNWGEYQKAKLDERLKDYFVYGVNEPLCQQWASITAEASSKGRPIEVDDAWIAATALLYDYPLITHNRKHFRVLEPGLTVISEAPEA